MPAGDAPAAPRRSVSVPSAAPCWHLREPAGGHSPEGPKGRGGTDTVPKLSYLPTG